MTEYIVQIEDSEKNMSERFVGQLRSYPELIRCKDCRYSYEGCTKYVCERTFHEFTVEPDGYCAWAKRRKENG